MIPACADQGIGLLPWSPLARGRLARPWGADTKRLQTDPFGKTLYAPYEDEDRKIVAEVEAIAKARGATMAQVALAWLLRKKEVSAPDPGRHQAAATDRRDRCG